MVDDDGQGKVQSSLMKEQNYRHLSFQDMVDRTAAAAVYLELGQSNEWPEMKINLTQRARWVIFILESHDIVRRLLVYVIDKSIMIF